MIRRFAAALALAALLLGPICGAERFVSPQGSDDNDGATLATAFATVQRGVDALEPGDTLTIAPGEYMEAVSREGLGSEDTVTTIRAQRPGTVLLRGDEAAPAFRKVDGFRFVYAAEFPRRPQAVNEADTLTIFETAPNVAELEFSPGRFHYDEDSRTLYISTSDFQPPDRHHYTVSTVEGRAGLFLREAQSVVVEGLAATGYFNRVAFPRLPGGNFSDHIAWGFYLSHCRDTVIRNCTAYLNAGGIGSQTAWREEQGRGNVFEGCLAYGNHSSLGESFGNLIIVNPSQDTICDSVARLSRNHGIRTHGRSELPGVLFEGNLSWGHGAGDYQIKSYSAEDRAALTLVTRCVTPQKTVNASTVTHSLIARAAGHEQHPTNIYLEEESDLELEREFADPVNHDYRLQATSRFRGTGPDGEDRGPYPYEENIHYLSPDGDDWADGLSVESAWRTLGRAFGSLEAGDTLYLTDGTYEAGDVFTVSGSAERPISIRGRAKEAPIVAGALALRGSEAVAFERVSFAEPVAVSDSRGIGFENCRFFGETVSLAAEGVDGLRVEHSELSGFEDAGLRLSGAADVFVRGVLFDNADGPAIEADRAEALVYSDYNGFRSAEKAWRVAGETVALEETGAARERHSRVVAPLFETRDGVPRLLNKGDLAARGPLGNALGTYRPDATADLPLRVVEPTLHSVTDTTANIEWWSSEPETFTVRWGKTPDLQNSVTLSPINPYHPHGTHLDPYSTFSLTGLEPETRYYFSLARGDTEHGRLEFVTAAAPPEPRELHVATDGDDANDGLTRATAWRTINRAADQARPGDTMLIGGGTYHEFVRVRSTGTRGAPITFRAAPGEKVVLDGHERNLHSAFSIFNKAFVRVDGLYFQNFNRVWTRGLFNLVRSRNIEITRCFADGRSPGTSPELLTAGGGEDILIQNCVMNIGWGGIAVGSVERLRFENNIIFRSDITPIGFGAGMRDAMVRNNIVTDNLAVKRFASLAPTGAQVTLENNCFYLRWPEEERSVFGRDGTLLEEYNRQAEAERENIAADPRFAVLAEEKPAEETVLFADSIPRLVNDFPDAFATNPTLVERGIGLQPEAFEDFHFNAPAE